MEIVYQILVVLHFVGLASLLGGVLVQMSSFRTGAKINPAMLHGALTQLVTGLLMVVIAELGEGSVNHMKIGVKLGVVLVITVLVLVFRKKAKPATWVVPVVGLLTLANVVIAVMWR